MSRSPAPRFPNKILFIGILLILLGTVLLLWTSGLLVGVVSLWPVVPIAIGVYLIYIVFRRNARESYVFLGMILLLGGIAFLLLNTILTAVALSRIWPVFMSIVGVSLYGYGLKKRGTKRLSLVVPAAAIFLLSLLFLPFSLDIAEQEFVQFVSVWWPTLFLVLGLVLIVLDIWRRRRSL